MQLHHQFFLGGGNHYEGSHRTSDVKKISEWDWGGREGGKLDDSDDKVGGINL